MDVNPYESPRATKKKGNELTFGDIAFYAIAAVSAIVVGALFIGFAILVIRARF
jgi:hypothetical protein